MTTDKKKTEPKIIATGFALGLITLSLVVYILNVAATVMVPFLMAVFLWYLINGLARGFGSLKFKGRTFPRVWCFFLAICCLLFGFSLVFELIRGNVQQVIAAAPSYKQQFEVILPKMMALLGLDHVPTVREILQQVDLSDIIRHLAGIFTGIAGKTFEVMFFTGFLLYEQRFFNNKITGMIENKMLEGKIRHIIHNIDLKIQRYIWVKTTISALAGVATWLILTAVKEDFAGFWALMAFVLHFIPYVGALAAIILPSIVALIQFGSLGTFFFVTASLSAALLTIGNILDPRLLGDSLNLSPIGIILSLAMWGMIWGVPGMFLAIPILAIIVIVLSQFEATRPIAVLLSKTGVIDKKMETRGPFLKGQGK
jgi:predicted PurR-regulated permease PerM